MEDFLQQYLTYTKDSEPPTIYHRWSCLSMVAAMLGRSMFIQQGPTRVYPNLYVIMIGEPATRKSFAIKWAAKIATAASYENFAADKTSKEKFWMDLAGIDDDIELGRRSYDQVTSDNLWGPDSESNKEPRECWIAADEFSEFAGTGNSDFYTNLGNLWDWDNEERPFKQRVKNSKSVSIWQPTINILGGTTPEKFASTFPVGIIGDGFLSRTLFIHGKKSARKFTIIPIPTSADTATIIASIQTIRSKQRGLIELSIESPAYRVLDPIYKNWQDMEDVRFKTYGGRRYTQLLKLCLILVACKQSKHLTEEIVIEANTILSAAEKFMPAALGEFGKSKFSDTNNKIMDVLGKATKPVTAKDLWKQVNQDLEKPTQLHEILQGLLHADKIQVISGSGGGYLPKKSIGKQLEFVDWSLLTEEERIGL